MNTTALESKSAAFNPNRLNKTLSPYTGLDRSHWIDIGSFLLEGMFTDIQSYDQALNPPLVSQKCVQADPSDKVGVKAAEFESLARTLLLAAPLINDNPEISVNNIKLKDYYLNQLLLATDPKSELFLGFLDSYNRKSTDYPHPHVVQGGGLAVGLLQCLDHLWHAYSKKEQDQIAACIKDWSMGMTYLHNYRFFNLLMSTFLMMHGYDVDKDIYYDHLHNVSAWYMGDGWYRDGLLINYYCPWAFHFYAPIWCKCWGYEHEPEIAALFEQRHLAFQKTYHQFFGKNGEMPLWGRSIHYRFAAASPLPMSYLLNQSDTSRAGEYRRICSGNLLQFVTRPDMYCDKIPNLGFYRQYDPVIQDYARAGSPFWCAKVFYALSLPKDHPFWTAPETDSIWGETNNNKEISTSFLPGPGIHVSNHKKSGYTELRTCKVKSKEQWDNKLAFNTHFQADQQSALGPSGMQYSLQSLRYESVCETPLEIKFHKFVDGVLYRQLAFNPGDYRSFIDLAEIVLPQGVLRIDRIRLNGVKRVMLGHYGLQHEPHATSLYNTITVGNYHGVRGKSDDKQIALINMHGWDDIQTQQNYDLNPEYKHTELAYCSYTAKKHYGGMKILSSLMLQKISNDNWTDDELNIVKTFKTLDITPSGDICGAQIELHDGQSYTIDFNCIEGSFSQ